MEESELVDWSRTSVALTKLMSLFTCTACRNTLREPCSFQMCDHYFCTTCAMDLTNNSTNCPACNAVLWREHLQTNLKIPEVMKICEQIKSLICTDEQRFEEDEDIRVQNIDNDDNDDSKQSCQEDVDNHVENIDNDNTEEEHINKKDINTSVQNMHNENSLECNTYVFERPMSAGGNHNIREHITDKQCHSVDMVEINDDSEKVENQGDGNLSGVSQDHIHCSITCSVTCPAPLEVITHIKSKTDLNLMEKIGINSFCNEPDDDMTFNDDSDGSILPFPLTNESNKGNASMAVDLHHDMKEEINCNNNEEDSMKNEAATSKNDNNIDSSIDFVNYGKHMVNRRNDFQRNKKDCDIVLTSVKCKGKKKGITCDLTTEQENRSSTCKKEESVFDFSSGTVTKSIKFEKKSEESGEDDSVQEAVNGSSESPEKSQFSNAVSDLDCVNGVQRNPNSFTKKPKFTYAGKHKGSRKTTAKNNSNMSMLVTSRASTCNKEESVFDFCSGTITKSIKFEQKGQESSEDDKISLAATKRAISAKRKRGMQCSKASTKKTDYGKGKHCSEKENTKESYKAEEKKTKANVPKSKIRNLEKMNKLGETPLHSASVKGKYDRVKELLELGAQANTKDFNGWTPLHEASSHGFIAIVELLLDYNAIIDCVAGEDNDTPLHDAVCNNCVEVVRLLLRRGAPTNIKNRSGLYPEGCAATNEMKNVFKEMSMFETNDETLCDNQLNLSSASSGAPFVFITTNLNPSQSIEVTKCCDRLGGMLLSEFDQSVTHVICGLDVNGISKLRTMKYLFGILTGKWLVSLNWINDSLKENKWMQEASYELKGSLGALDQVPQKSRINNFKCLPKLFEGCSFYLSGIFNEKLSKDVVTNLIKLGGGKILYREPKISDLEHSITPLSPQNRTLNLESKVIVPVTIYHAKSNSAQVCCKEYIIYDLKENPGHKKICSPVLCTAPVPWLLDCISNFQILDVQDAHDQKEGYKSSQN